jgi:hypothetical protein
VLDARDQASLIKKHVLKTLVTRTSLANHLDGDVALEAAGADRARLPNRGEPAAANGRNQLVST